MPSMQNHKLHQRAKNISYIINDEIVLPPIFFYANKIQPA